MTKGRYLGHGALVKDKFRGNHYDRCLQDQNALQKHDKIACGKNNKERFTRQIARRKPSLKRTKDTSRRLQNRRPQLIQFAMGADSQPKRSPCLLPMPLAIQPSMENATNCCMPALSRKHRNPEKPLISIPDMYIRTQLYLTFLLIQTNSCSRKRFVWAQEYSTFREDHQGQESFGHHGLKKEYLTDVSFPQLIKTGYKDNAGSQMLVRI